MVKWQDILKYGGTGTIGLFFLLAMLVNLTGMTYNSPGDQTCGTDCYSEIKVNSSYWNICVEHSGTKDIVYKKSVTSQVLWINLDKINELVPTNPTAKVELLIPTTSKSSTVKTELGYLRPVKDGDCIIKRITKTNPNPSRIIIHGIKEPWQTIKWGFKIDHYTTESINIDPIWKGIERKIDIKNYKTCENKIFYYQENNPIYEWINKTKILPEIETEIYETYESYELVNHYITKNYTKCVDSSYLTINFGDDTFRINYAESDFNCSIIEGPAVYCDSCIERGGKCNGKPEYNREGSRIGEHMLFMNATHIIEDNSGLPPDCNLIDKKNTEFIECIDPKLSKNMRLPKIE